MAAHAPSVEPATGRPDAAAVAAALEAAFPGDAVQVRDDSAAHAGHAGAREGGHYRVTIVSSQFAKLNTLARHRLVYDAVGNLMQHGIHALVIDARITDEV